ncbi:MAG: hypothetical protein R2939_11990 [Kofleriaceae bacterium]
MTGGRLVAAAALALVAGAAGCGERTLKAAGEPCSGSSECAVGLLCDFGQAEPVCAGNSTLPDAQPARVDADPMSPDGAPDARPDAMPDAMPDAAPDAAPDAMV